VVRPVLKRSIPYFVADGAIHFRLSGTLTSLDDPDGRVLALLGLLDGTHDAKAICRELGQQYPDLTADDVRTAIADLDDSGLIQDAADGGTDFSAADLDRWSNNFGFFETYASLGVSKYEFQRRIAAARIAVLGVGGVGTHALIDLVAIGFTDIRIVDFDTVELSNLNRQILYGEPFLGQHKVQVAADRARALNSGLRLDVVQERMLSADAVYRAVHDRDIVIGSVDGPKMDIAHWLNQGCVRAGAALISGGVEAQRGLLFTIVPGVSGCSACWYDSVQESDPTSRMLGQAMREAEQRGESFGEDTAAFNGLVVLLSAHMVGEVVRLASRVSHPVSVGRVLEISFHDPQIRQTEEFKRRGDCAVCRGAAPAAGVAWLSGDAS
jgi:molybdopterin/thiamine biosynthesis adenylyltransferase